MMTDPVSDMLTRIRNAAMARHERTEVPASQLKQHIAEILKAEGYIADVRPSDVDASSLTIVLTTLLILFLLIGAMNVARAKACG